MQSPLAQPEHLPPANFQQTDPQQRKVRLGFFRRLPSWIRLTLKVILLTLLIASPGIIDYSIYRLRQQKSLISGNLIRGQITLDGATLAVWSYFLAGSYLVFQMCSLSVFLLPMVLKKVCGWMVGKLNTSYDVYIGYISDLHLFITNWIFTIILAVSWSVLFGQETRWRLYVWYAISAGLVGTFVFICEKLFIRILAVRFHSSEYQQRLAECSSRSGVVRKLNKYAHKINKKRAAQLANRPRPKLQQNRANESGYLDDLDMLIKPTRPLERALSLSDDISQPLVEHGESVDIDALFSTEMLPSPEIEGRLWPFITKVSPVESAPSASVKSPNNLADKLESGLFFDIEREAERATRRIFAAFTKKSDLPIAVDNLRKLLPDHGFANGVINLFDVNKDGVITRGAMQDTIQEIYTDSQNLVASLRQVQSAIASLDTILSTITWIMILFSALIITRVSIESLLVSGASLMLSATFIFGDSAATMFDGIIFLFVTHPFDVGDVIVIENDSPTYTVNNMGILQTSMAARGLQTYYPNSVLMSLNITNFKHSRNETELVEIDLSFDTPVIKIDMLREKLAQFVQNDLKKSQSRLQFQMVKADRLNSIKLVVWLEDMANWQHGLARLDRRSQFLLHMIDALRELEISFDQVKQSLQFRDPVSIHFDMSRMFVSQ